MMKEEQDEERKQRKRGNKKKKEAKPHNYHVSPLQSIVHSSCMQSSQCHADYANRSKLFFASSSPSFKFNVKMCFCSAPLGTLQ